MDETNRSRWLAAACFAGLFVWLLWDVLLLPNNFAFRDFTLWHGLPTVPPARP